jgi:hypothetical protein
VVRVFNKNMSMQFYNLDLVHIEYLTLNLFMPWLMVDNRHYLHLHEMLLMMLLLLHNFLCNSLFLIIGDIVKLIIIYHQLF